MDEPTAALGVAQTAMVLDLIKTLAGRGVAVLVISHNLIDVFEVADRIAVLYLGRLVVSGPASEFDRQSVVEYMTTGARDASGGADRGMSTPPEEEAAWPRPQHRPPTQAETAGAAGADDAGRAGARATPS